MINIPILLTVKGTTQRDIKNGIDLLPYIYDYIESQQILKYTVVISDADEILNYAHRLGFLQTYKEQCVKCRFCNIDFNGPYHFFRDTQTDCEWYIVIPINQPFKSKNLILNTIYAINDNYDFITSYSHTVDRYSFYIDDDNKFIKKNDNHKNTKVVKMLDEAIFAVKKSYLLECVKSGDPHKKFWEGKFKTIENDSIFFPVNNAFDMSKFNKTEEIFNRVRETVIK